MLGGKSSFKLLQCSDTAHGWETLQEGLPAQSSPQTDTDFKLLDILFSRDKMGKK